MQCEITLTLSDWEEYQSFVSRKVVNEDGSSGPGRFFAVIFLWAVLGALFMYYIDKHTFDGGTALGVAAVFALIVLVFAQSANCIRRLCRPIVDEGVWKVLKFNFTQQGYILETDGLVSNVSWSAIHEVAESKNYLYIFLGRLEAEILPKAQIANVGELVQMISESLGSAKVKKFDW